MPPLTFLEALFRFLLPPASREHVLGDLHEMCKTPRQYIRAAASVLAPVIISRIRRTTDAQVCLMEAFAIYASLLSSAWWLGEKTFLYGHSGFCRLLIPTVITVAGLLLCNAYADPQKQSPLMKPILQTAGSLALAFAGQTLLFDTSSNLAAPFEVMLYGSCMSFVLVATLRMLFPPVFSGRPRSAFLNSPQFFGTRGLTPAKVSIERIRQMMNDRPSPPRFKIAFTFGVAVLLMVVVMFVYLRRT